MAMSTTRIFAVLLAAGAQLAACTEKASSSEDLASPMPDEEADSSAGSQMFSPDGLAVTSAWMPRDWDGDVYQGAGQLSDDEAIRKARQNMINTLPLTLWAVANDTLVTEAFEPIWVWYTAIRSCERGIALSEDLAGEFGNRERGQAGLVAARSDLRKWAATQPTELTASFSARLGQWNAASGAFPIQQAGKATTLKPRDAARFDPFHDGATVEMWSESTRHGINHLQVSLLAPQCVSPDGQMIHKFEKMSQWWIIFGDAERGMGGLVRYNKRAFLPEIRMSREQAAAFAQRNPERRVDVAITFGPAGSSFIKYTDQSAIRAALQEAVITDALDGTVLARQTY